MGYSLVLLDLDGTLLDFEEAQRKGIEKALNEFGLPYSDKVLDAYVRVNDRWWIEFEKGAASKDELFIRRFVDFLEEMGWNKELAASINTYYLQILPSCKVISELSLNLCKELSKRADIVIATNGDEKGQMSTIESSGIMSYIKGVAVSEAIGWPKPDPRFFSYAMGLVSPREKRETLMVGDSLSADIRGGMDFGIDTCWFNPKGSPAVQGIEPTYTIMDLAQILEIV